jgi:threonine dehydrogenase-like Zn-dependent dehydrogenase
MSRSVRRRDLAMAMGANEFIPYGSDEAGEVRQALGGAPQVVFEAVGAEGMLAKAVAHAGQFARIVSLGFCTTPDALIPALGSYKCVSIQFVVGYSMTEFLYIADQMDKGHADPKAIITREIPLAELPSMMSTLRGSNNETKGHVRMH